MSKLTAIALTATIGALTLTSCGKKSHTDDTISNFGIDATIKTAAQSYRFVVDSVETYGSLSTSLYWPERLGGHPIKVLQDSIISKLYGLDIRSRNGIDGAINRFLDNTSLFAVDAEMTPLDSLPDNQRAEMAWYVEQLGNIIDLNDRFVTYKVTHNLYGGGAHPNTIIDMFTYDLSRGEALNLDNMFVAGSNDKLLEIVKETLAGQLGTTVDRLDEAGIFAEQLCYLGQPCIIEDTIVFHYNAYEIAPYSMGNIDINIWGGEIEEYLTPAVKALINN